MRATRTFAQDNGSAGIRQANKLSSNCTKPHTGQQCSLLPPPEGHRGANPDLESKLKNTVFQIRSSLAQFPMRERFVRIDFLISSVFSIAPNIPTPPPPLY